LALFVFFILSAELALFERSLREPQKTVFPQYFSAKILWKNGKGIMPLNPAIDKPERRRNGASFGKNTILERTTLVA
jgi:hypothetical protein